jgi:hypothetical protein
MADSRSAIDSAPWPYPSFPQQEEAGPRRFKIPKKLKKGYMTLLKATDEDYTLGRVRKIECRWCHDSFKRWKDFKRHCNTSEVHPLKIIFCDCGDHCTSDDALKRHQRRGRPYFTCRTRNSGVDARTRRRMTEEAHRKFIEELDQCLRDIGRKRSFKGIIESMIDHEEYLSELVPDSERGIWPYQEDAALSSECCTLVDPEEDVAHC